MNTATTQTAYFKGESNTICEQGLAAGMCIGVKGQDTIYLRKHSEYVEGRGNLCEGCARVYEEEEE